MKDDYLGIEFSKIFSIENSRAAVGKANKSRQMLADASTESKKQDYHLCYRAHVLLGYAVHVFHTIYVIHAIDDLL